MLLTLTVLVSLYATYDIAVSLPKIAGMVLGIGAFYAVARAGDRLAPGNSLKPARRKPSRGSRLAPTCWP